MSRQTPSLSFEVFPPTPAMGNDKIISALQDMQKLAPHFISVTASNNKFGNRSGDPALHVHLPDPHRRPADPPRMAVAHVVRHLDLTRGAGRPFGVSSFAGASGVRGNRL